MSSVSSPALRAYLLGSRGGDFVRSGRSSTMEITCSKISYFDLKK
jgi:hypothetical protein